MGISNTSAAGASTLSDAKKPSEPFDFEAAFKNADFSFDAFNPLPLSPKDANKTASLASPPTSHKSATDTANIFNVSPLPNNDDDDDQPLGMVRRSKSVNLEDSHDDFESRFPALPIGSSSLLESLDLAFGARVSIDESQLGFEDAFGDQFDKKDNK
jgi:hypothetical protein